MRSPSWYRATPQPLRWAVGGAIVLALVGAAYGIAESARDYPFGAWFAVTLYVALLGALAGFVLGVVAGAVRIIAAALARRS